MWTLGYLEGIGGKQKEIIRHWSELRETFNGKWVVNSVKCHKKVKNETGKLIGVDCGGECGAHAWVYTCAFLCLGRPTMLFCVRNCHIL